MMLILFLAGCAATNQVREGQNGCDALLKNPFLISRGCTHRADDGTMLRSDGAKYRKQYVTPAGIFELRSNLEGYTTYSGSSSFYMSYETYRREWIVTPQGKETMLYPACWPNFQCLAFVHGPERGNGRTTDLFQDLFTASDGQVYLITWRNIWKWTPEEGIFTPSLQAPFRGSISIPEKTDGIFPITWYGVEKDHPSDLISLFTGLMYFDPTTNAWKAVEYKGTKIDGVEKVTEVNMDFYLLTTYDKKKVVFDRRVGKILPHDSK